MVILMLPIGAPRFPAEIALKVFDEFMALIEPAPTNATPLEFELIGPEMIKSPIPPIVDEELIDIAPLATAGVVVDELVNAPIVEEPPLIDMALSTVRPLRSNAPPLTTTVPRPSGPEIIDPPTPNESFPAWTIPALIVVPPL